MAATLPTITCPRARPRRVSANCDTGWLRTYGRNQPGKVCSGAMPVESMNSSSWGTNSRWLAPCTLFALEPNASAPNVTARHSSKEMNTNAAE